MRELIMLNFKGEKISAVDLSRKKHINSETLKYRYFKMKLRDEELIRPISGTRKKAVRRDNGFGSEVEQKIERAKGNTVSTRYEELQKGDIITVKLQQNGDVYTPGLKQYEVITSEIIQKTPNLIYIRDSKSRMRSFGEPELLTKRAIIEGGGISG